MLRLAGKRFILISHQTILTFRDQEGKNKEHAYRRFIARIIMYDQSYRFYVIIHQKILK